VRVLRRRSTSFWTGKRASKADGLSQRGEKFYLRAGPGCIRRKKYCPSGWQGFEAETKSQRRTDSSNRGSSLFRCCFPENQARFIRIGKVRVSGEDSDGEALASGFCAGHGANKPVLAILR